MNTNLTKFDQLKADIQTYAAPIKEIVVNSKESHDSAMEVAKQIKNRLKRVEDLRTELKAPHLEAGKEIDKYANDIKNLLTEPSNHLNQQFLSYNRHLEQVRQEELKKLREKEEAERQAAAKQAEEAKANAEFEKSLGLNDQATKTELVANNQLERAAAQITKQTKAEAKKIEDMKVKGVRKTWDFEVLDASKVPAEFLMVDEVKLRKAVLAADGKIEVPGVRVFQKESMTIR
jgi:hypothetical protein